MKNDRKIDMYLSTVLSLANTADDFGFRELLPDFAQWTGYVTDEEIKDFASDFLSKKGYTEEDYEVIKENLIEWRDRYCKGGK